MIELGSIAEIVSGRAVAMNNRLLAAENLEARKLLVAKNKEREWGLNTYASMDLILFLYAYFKLKRFN
jgi:hypothetical protein